MHCVHPGKQDELSFVFIFQLNVELLAIKSSLLKECRAIKFHALILPFRHHNLILPPSPAFRISLTLSSAHKIRIKLDVTGMNWIHSLMTHRQFFSIFITGVVVESDIHSAHIESGRRYECVAGEHFHPISATMETMRSNKIFHF